MQDRISHHLQTVYLKGSHADFEQALADAIAEPLDGRDDFKSVEIGAISHSLAVEQGEMHWSAIVHLILTEEGDA